MFSQTTKTTTRVLHIRQAAPDIGPVAGLDSRLTAAGVRVETRSDVYGGLAGICRRGAEPVNVIVVRVDDLTAAEMEFFSIVSRLFPSTRVYVYGRERSAGKVTQACELGADSELTARVIGELTSSGRAIDRTPVATSPVISEPPPVIERIETSPVPPEPLPRPATEAHDQPAQVHEDEVDNDGIKDQSGPVDEAMDEEAAEDQSGAARVPWLRYKDQPSRGALARRPPSPKDSEDAAISSHGSAEPLLTEEELQALLGDDVSAIAPRARKGPARDTGEERRPT